MAEDKLVSEHIWEYIVGMRETKPPYISVVRLEKALELVSTRNLSNITPLMFVQYDFNEGDATLAVSALRFLGIIDDGGSATPLMAKLRLRGDARKPVFKEIVVSAYKKLFDAVEAPQNLLNDELTNEFILHYGLTPRVARSAIPAFLKLAEFAGLKEASLTPTRTIKPRERKITAERKQNKSQESAPIEGVHVHPIVKGKMTLTIPEELFLRSATDDTLNAAWRKVLKEAHKFADDYLKDQAPNSEEQGAS